MTQRMPSRFQRFLLPGFAFKGGTLEHWQYDSFITRFDDKTIEPAYVTFSLNSNGKVDRVTMKAVSPLADFSYDYQDLLFTPVQGTFTVR
jgi:hypothetical protein